MLWCISISHYPCITDCGLEHLSSLSSVTLPAITRWLVKHLSLSFIWRKPSCCMISEAAQDLLQSHYHSLRPNSSKVHPMILPPNLSTFPIFPFSLSFSAIHWMTGEATIAWCLFISSFICLFCNVLWKIVFASCHDMRCVYNTYLFSGNLNRTHDLSDSLS